MRRRRPDNPANAAEIALGIGATLAVGYGAYKLFDSLFGSSNEPHQEISTNKNKIHVVNTVEECRRFMREVKSYIPNISIIFLFPFREITLSQKYCLYFDSGIPRSITCLGLIVNGYPIMDVIRLPCFS